jgi:hypothetical protein
LPELCRSYLHSAFRVTKLYEKLGDLAPLEDEYANHGTEGGELGEHGLVVDFEDNGIVNAGEKDPRWRFVELGCSFFLII